MTLIPFFPADVFGDERGAPPGLSSAQWYSMFLEGMAEPPLFGSQTGSIVTIRLLVLPAFGSPHLVRVWRSAAASDVCHVITKRHNGRGGPGSGPDMDVHEAVLGFTHAVRIVQELARLGFWSMPTSETVKGLDGTDWVLEVVEAARYHVAHRWCPKAGPFADCCRLLGELADRRLFAE